MSFYERIARPDLLESGVTPVREWIRRHVDRQGVAAMDVDLLLRLYGRGFVEKLALCEIKSERAGFPFAERRTFRQLDELLRLADPERDAYLGFFLLRWSYGRNSPFSLNDRPITARQFQGWCQGDLDWQPYRWGAGEGIDFVVHRERLAPDETGF